MFVAASARGVVFLSDSCEQGWLTLGERIGCSSVVIMTEPAPIEMTDVATVFASYPEAVRPGLFALRQLILDTAEETSGVGAVEETLKWHQPAYLTTETGSGSTVRIAPTGPTSDHDYAMYFICHTDLVATFEHTFGDIFNYERNRALLFRAGDDIPEAELRECVTMALTYHQSKK